MEQHHEKKEEQQARPRVLSGTVVSSKMKDTVVVSVSRFRKHPKYGKYQTRSQRFKAHDKGNTCAEGDVVFIREVKPISKDKHFVVVGKKTAVSKETDSAAAEDLS